MVKLSKILLPILLLLAVFLNTTSVYAATWEIITHGGYEAAVSAWQRVALIFTDNNYKTLALPVAVLGAIILYLSVAARIALGGKGNLLAGWGTPFIIGLIIYIAFIIPKDSVVIYDETLNRGPQQINNIPRGIATIAGLLNKIENGFTNIIWTASDPSTDYRIQAGGTGFTIIGNFLMGVDALPVSFRATLDKYVHDCVLIELQRTGTQLNLNAIQSGQQKANFVIQQSRNPALFTVSYLNSTTGDAMTCQDAGQAILSWLNNPDNVKPMAQHACKSAGYSPNNVNSYNACVNTATSILATVTGNDLVALWGNNSLAAQSTLATAIQDVVTQYNPENAIRALATSQSMSSFIGMGVHANSWIPVIKETLMALAVGLTPLFAIILITPLAGRAFSIMAGMFVWLTVWGIIDAVIHSFAMEQAFNNATMLKSTDGYASGITAMMLFPTYSQKVVAMFGAVRWFGLMLSSVITGMFLKFGGTAMAMLAGSLSGTVQSTGAAYGEKVLRNPAGLYNDAIAQTSITNAAKMTPGGLAGYMAGMTAYQSGSMAGQARVGSELGAGAIAQGKFISEASSIAKSAFVDSRIVQQLQNAGYSREEALAIAAASHFDPRKTEAFTTMDSAGMLQGGSSYDKLIDFGRYGTELPKMTSSGYRQLRIGNVTYQMDPQGGVALVGADLGQLNVKSAAMKQVESQLDSKSGKELVDSYKKLINWAHSQNAEWGVARDTLNEFATETVKKMVDKILHSDALKQHMDTETQHSLYTELSMGTPKAINLVSPVDARAGYKLNIITKTGESKTYTVSREVGEELDNIQRESIRDTVSEFSRNSDKISKLIEFAKQADAKEFAGYAEMHRFAQAYSQTDTFTENAQFTAFTSGVLSKSLGRAVSYEESAEHIRRLASSNNPKDSQLLKDLLSEYANYRFYSYEISQMQNKVNTDVSRISGEVSVRGKEVEAKVNQGVPTVVDTSSPGHVNEDEYRQHAESVQTGLNNKKQIIGGIISLGFLGPVVAGAYNLGNHIYTMGYSPSFNNSSFATWNGKAPVFGSPTDIYFKPQQKLNLNITDTSVPIFMASPQEQKARWERLDSQIKDYVNRSGLK